MKIIYLILIILGLGIFIQFSYADFNIQTDEKYYKITGIDQPTVYQYEIINENFTLAQSNRILTPANNEQLVLLPFQNKSGSYTWNWYDSTKNTLIDSIKWTVFKFPINQNNSDPLIEIFTTKSNYSQNELVEISGKIKSYEWGNPVIIQVLNEKNQLIQVSQIAPTLDGNFKTTFTTSGKFWKNSQEITIRINYLEKMKTLQFSYISDERFDEIDQIPFTTSKLKIKELTVINKDLKNLNTNLQNKVELINSTLSKLEIAINTNDTSQIQQLQEKISSLIIFVEIYEKIIFDFENLYP